MPGSLMEYRRLALMALWTGLIATVGIFFAFIPNIELVILSAFLGGVALGPKRGFIVAVIGEAIFSALNPIGSGLGFPLLYLFQLVSVGLSGLGWGLLFTSVKSIKHPVLQAALLGGAGFGFTLVYDVLTALSFPLSSGMTEGTLIGSITTGFIFFFMHLVSNTLLFSLFGPGLVRLVDQQIMMNGLGDNR